MHAHEVPAAPVPARVVLELRLGVEPRLHGGPLVRRVAGAVATQAHSAAIPLGNIQSVLVSSATSPFSKHTHTHTLQVLSKITKTVIREAPRIPFTVPRGNSQANGETIRTYSQALAIRGHQGTDGSAIRLLYGLSFLSEFKSGWKNTQRFLRFNYLPFTFSKQWEEAFGEVGTSFEELLSVVLSKTDCNGF